MTKNSKTQSATKTEIDQTLKEIALMAAIKERDGDNISQMELVGMEVGLRAERDLAFASLTNWGKRQVTEAHINNDHFARANNFARTR